MSGDPKYIVTCDISRSSTIHVGIVNLSWPFGTLCDKIPILNLSLLPPLLLSTDLVSYNIHRILNGNVENQRDTPRITS